MGTRYIYFASQCNVSQAPSAWAFDKTTYRFALSNGYYRYAGELIAPTTTTTTTTTSTTTTTTVPATTTTSTVVTQSVRSTTTSTVLSAVPSKAPSSPESVSISAISGSSIRVRWSDTSANEEGFLVQRSDLPVPSGTSTANWPYKAGAGQTSFDISGVAAGKQVCVAVASFTKTAASSFTPWVCAVTPGGSGDVVATTLPSEIPSLSCDAEVASVSKGQAAVSINAGVVNAGKLSQFEVYKAGKWYVLGSARISASGVAIVQTDSRVLNQRGKFAIRATQGSRFICEGNIVLTRNLKLKGSLKLSNRG